MFAPKVAKPQTKAAESPTSKLAPRSAVFATRPFGGGAVEQAHFLQSTIGNQAALRLLSQWGFSPTRGKNSDDHEQGIAQENMVAPEAPRDVSCDFSKIPLFPPDRASPAPRPSLLTERSFGTTDAPCVADRPEVHDQGPPGPGSAAPAPAPTPAAPTPPAPTGPTVDRIDLVNTPTGAISGYGDITNGDLNTPGPFNSSTTNGVGHALQVHFHLDNGNSSALTPRREIQRTSTIGGTVSMNPPDQPAPGGIGPPTPGGFKGVLIGPDGPGSHEIQRTTADKIVVADAPGMAPLPTGSFPVTYKAHFAVTVTAASTDVARINYDVLIDKRTATDVPNTENRSFSTKKLDLVRGRSLP